MLNRSSPALLFCLLLLLMQPLAAQDDEFRDPDPWEGWNRNVYRFNQFADRYLLKPVAKAYQAVTPEIVDVGVTNFFRNLREPITIFNDLLQLKLGQAGMDSGRFVLNTTLGLAGFFDVASDLGLPRHREDFGQSLGYWGLEAGPYLELPLLGSSSARDAFGLIPDIYVSPVVYVNDEIARAAATGLRVTDLRADLLRADELVTGDRYIFLRDSYLQQREALVLDGEVEDDFGDEDF
ncbi:MAG: MlaA family lipoprotein [Pseudomonadales bacterium]